VLKLRAKEKKKFRGANRRKEMAQPGYKKRGRVHKEERYRKTFPHDKSCKGEGRTHSVFIQ